MYFPPQDRIFQIEVTTQCNLKCEGCSRTVGVNAGQWKNQHIPLETFRKAVAATRPAEAIILQGIGEPTLHPQLPELISIAKESGKFHTIAFYTNGLARSIEYYDDLKARGNNLVTVSVDSLDPVIAEQCRAGTDVMKLTKRLCELYYTHAPNMNVSLVLSRKNMVDCFETLRKLDIIASAGGEYITVFIQRMIATSDDIQRDFILSDEETRTFCEAMRARKGLYKKLRIGLTGDLNSVEPATANAAAAPPAPFAGLCDKPYVDRFVTIDGYLTPCCVMTNDQEFEKTPLDGPLQELFASSLPIVRWFKEFQTVGNKHCAGCSIASPGNHALQAALMAERNPAQKTA